MSTVQKTTIDYLRFRTQAEPPEVLEALRPMFGDLGRHLGWQHLKRGAMGFQRASQVVLGDMPLARLDFGGESQRGWVRAELTGRACGWVQDWEAVRAVEELPSAQVRRLDVALTTWEGEITHERVVQAHQEGRFCTGGRPPALQQVISTDPRAGRTCYVGKRKSSKFFRAYEKGFQMAAKSGLPGDVQAIDGHPIEGIYRCELELKAGDDDASPIGWEVIGRRDHYFAGSYPFCSDVLPEVEPDVFERRKEREPQTDLSAALATVRTQYGKTLFTALAAYHGDILAVWDKVVGKEHAQHLLEAGVLLVDHD